MITSCLSDFQLICCEPNPQLLSNSYLSLAVSFIYQIDRLLIEPRGQRELWGACTCSAPALQLVVCICSGFDCRAAAHLARHIAGTQQQWR